MISLSNFLILSALLFCIGISGIILSRKNLIILLMSIEIILLSANINFIAFSHYLNNTTGQIFVFFYFDGCSCRICNWFGNFSNNVS